MLSLFATVIALMVITIILGVVADRAIVQYHTNHALADQKQKIEELNRMLLEFRSQENVCAKNIKLIKYTSDIGQNASKIFIMKLFLDALRTRDLEGGRHVNII